MQYNVIYSSDLSELVRKVNTLLSEGWRLKGPCIGEHRSWHQTLIKGDYNE